MFHLIIFIATLVFALATTKILYKIIECPDLLKPLINSHQSDWLTAFEIGFIMDVGWLLIVGLTNFGWQPLLVLAISYLIENFNISISTIYYTRYHQVPFRS